MKAYVRCFVLWALASLVSTSSAIRLSSVERSSSASTSSNNAIEDDDGNNIIIIPYNKDTCRARPHRIPNNKDDVVRAPDVFLVEFPTTASGTAKDKVIDSETSLSSSSSPSLGPVVMEVHRSWAPIGVDRFWSLLKDHYYDCAAFFRVVPDFVVQFGIASTPDESRKWNIDDGATIWDDPVIQSNLYSYVSYATAGPNTRTAQIFINTANNPRLDEDGFAPFGRIVSGMDTVLALSNPTPNSTDGVDQDMYMSLGNEWIVKEYPNIDIIMGMPQVLVIQEELPLQQQQEHQHRGSKRNGDDEGRRRSINERTPDRNLRVRGIMSEERTTRR